jgi:16S rRNA (cytosine967-C5)-methyltransferase
MIKTPYEQDMTFYQKPTSEPSRQPSLPKERESMGLRRSAKRHNERTGSTAPQPGVAARLAALLTLETILHRRKTFDEALSQACRQSRLRLPLIPADRALIQQLVFGVLRHLPELKSMERHFIDRPLSDEQHLVSILIWMGGYQLAWLGMPPHAVVDTAVEAAKSQHATRGFAKLVNAVLRRIADSKQEKPWPKPENMLDGLPAWLRSRLESTYTPERLNAWANCWQSEPPLYLTFKQGAENWVEQHGGSLLPSGTVHAPQTLPADMTAWPGYEEGHWWVQDAAASLPVMLMGNLKGKKVLEIGAAPGGKTAQLFAAGAYVVALDRSSQRMKRLKTNLKRLQMEAECVISDAREYKPRLSFDAIVMDAPCSATGTIRRHPDLPHVKTEADIAELAALQAELLDKAVSWLKPGGELWYITCSLLPEEGEKQVDALVARHGNMARKPFQVSDLPPGLEQAPTIDGDIRLTPEFWQEHGGMDGFFISRLVKT